MVLLDERAAHAGARTRRRVTLPAHGRVDARKLDVDAAPEELVGSARQGGAYHRRVDSEVRAVDGQAGDWTVIIELFGAKGRVDVSVVKK